MSLEDVEKRLRERKYQGSTTLVVSLAELSEVFADLTRLRSANFALEDGIASAKDDLAGLRADLARVTGERDEVRRNAAAIDHGQTTWAERAVKAEASLRDLYAVACPGWSTTRGGEAMVANAAQFRNDQYAKFRDVLANRNAEKARADELAAALADLHGYYNASHVHAPRATPCGECRALDAARAAMTPALAPAPVADVTTHALLCPQSSSPGDEDCVCPAPPAQSSTVAAQVVAEVRERCPDCHRPKARNVYDTMRGDCPKWWAIRDPDANRDCARVKATIEPLPADEKRDGSAQ